MTLVNKQVGKINGKAELNSAAITATALDTTSPAIGPVIDNTQGKISYIAFEAVATNKTGTSPTLQIQMFGSNNGTDFAQLNNQSGSAMQSSAVSISAANGAGTNVAVFLDSQGSLRTSFPAYVEAQILIGGSASPGWTGVMSQLIIRDKYANQPTT